jgi:hypothetical protein
MPPEFYQRAGYIAVNSAVENATGRGKEPHAIPNMVMRYFVRHLKNSQLAAAPEGLKVKHLDLNKRGAFDLNKRLRAKYPPSNGCGIGGACTVSQF